MMDASAFMTWLLVLAHLAAALFGWTVPKQPVEPERAPTEDITRIRRLP